MGDGVACSARCAPLSRCLAEQSGQPTFFLVFFLQLLQHLVLDALYLGALAALLGHAQIGFGRIDVAVVFVADMVEQPAREHAM